MPTPNVTLRPIRTREHGFTIVGRTPLIVHQWSEKGKRQMAAKQQTRTKQVRQLRDPQAEYEATIYRLADGRPGFPVEGVKRAFCDAAHKDLGIARTAIRQAFFIIPDCVATNRVAILGSEPKFREDIVRLSADVPDLRYRAQFLDWRMVLRVELDEEAVSIDTIVALADRSGFGVGLGEFRPQRNGIYGRFEVLIDK